MTDKKRKNGKISHDNDSSIPMYLQIAETIKRRILSGQYNPGKQIFTSYGLEKEFQTSNITIRNAMVKLKNDGFVERRRGFGTTVSEIDPEPLWFELNNSFKKVKESIAKLNTQVKVLEITQVKASEYVRNFLSLNSGQEVCRMKRIRIYKGLPVSFYVYYADPGYFADISTKTVKKDDILYAMEEMSGIKIQRADQTWRSIIADIDISRALEISFGSPVFFNESIYHSASGEALILSQMYLRGDMFVFRDSRRF